jgi:CBS domain-containing protein
VTFQLARRTRGIDIDRPAATSAMAAIRVAEAMGQPLRRVTPEQPLREIVAPVTLPRTQSLDDAIATLAATDEEGLPVVDGRNRLIGWLTHRRLLRAHRNSTGQGSDVCRD